MKKLALFSMLFALSACSLWQDETAPFEPDYNRYAGNVSIVSTSSDSVVYEYKNIRVDELGAIAAQYCDDHGQRQAYLDKILLHKNNSRRAVFICRKM